MLRGPSAGGIEQWNLCLLGYIGLMFGMCHTLPDACVFNVVLRNFQLILSWELRNHSVEPTHYTLWHADTRKDMEVVQHCANITRPSCDVTHVWAEMSEMYHLRLVGSRGNATLVNCSGSIFPDTDVTMEPPRFEIAGFKDHMNVMLELPQALPKILTAGGSHLLLFIEEQSEGIVKRHDLQINEATNGNFTYVLDKLMPNTSYCVSVYFDSRNLGINRSPWKCTRLPPVRDSESSEPARIGALITVFLVAAVSIGTVGFLKRVGHICLRNVSPKVLISFYSGDPGGTCTQRASVL